MQLENSNTMGVLSLLLDDSGRGQDGYTKKIAYHLYIKLDLFRYLGIYLANKNTNINTNKAIKQRFKWTVRPIQTVAHRLTNKNKKQKLIYCLKTACNISLAYYTI